MVQSLYKTVWRFLKKTLKIELPHDPITPPPKKTKTNLKRYIQSTVHKSTIYNRQDIETAQVPINKQLA